MSGARASPTKHLVPIEGRVFGQFVQDYTDSVLLASSPEARSSAQADISQRIPPDVLWLFRQAWQSTLAPFSMEVESALGSTIKRVSAGYTSLAKTLVDRCFASAKAEQRYESVHELKDVFMLDQYRIVRLH